MTNSKFPSIKLQECEICGNESQYAMNDDKTDSLHFSCLIHADDLYRKLNGITTTTDTGFN